MGNKFGAVVCTSIEQYERLADLGINPNTSDMGWHKAYSLSEEIYKPFIKGYKLENNKTDIPAWTISKLIELSESPVTVDGCNIIISNKMFNNSNDIFNNMIDAIEFLINNNIFNKKYLI